MEKEINKEQEQRLKKLIEKFFSEQKLDKAQAKADLFFIATKLRESAKSLEEAHSKIEEIYEGI